MSDTSFSSYCGSCSQVVDAEAYEEMLWGGTVTLPCGHENSLEKLFVPLGPEGRAMKTNPETKRATYFILSTNPALEDTFGPDCTNPDGLLPMHSKAGAWDAYWSGDLKADGDLFLYEIKVYRFMDFNPRVMQSSESEFDTKEYEGSRFISRTWDPASMGVVIKRSYARLISKTPVTVEDAPEGSAYGTRVQKA